MNYSNPFVMMMNMGSNPFQQMMNMGQPAQYTPIDRNKLQNGINNLSKNDLANIVSQARARGIDEKDIEAGLNFILSLR